MKSIVEFFLKRPMIANLIIILVFGFGIFSILNLRKEAFPEITLGKFTIKSIYPGASASDVEINLTVPIEDAIKELENIQEMTSISREGLSIVNILADENISKDNLNKLHRDIDNKINTISNLPGNLKGKPELQEITSSDLPIIELAFEGSYDDLKDFVFDLKEELLLINGVLKVQVIGIGEQEIQILVDL
jgi:multidrug efflux pump subunit AcrB